MSSSTHVFHRAPKSAMPTAVRGDGIYVIDSTGKRYLDGSGGAAVSCLGHSDPDVTAAIKAQLDEIAFAHTGFFTSAPAEELADYLIARAPGDDTRRMRAAYFVSGGSEAVEAALKMARQYHLERGEPKRARHIARRQSYHGNTLGALSVGGNVWRREPYAPLLVDTSLIAPCYAYRDKLDDESDAEYGLRVANELETEILRLGPENVSAFIAETVGGATAGVIPPVAGYYKRIRDICDQYGVVMILDEVMCGMGRTGTLFACEQDGVTPDIVCIAKGLGAGYQPIGATLVTDTIYNAFIDGSGAFQHGHTYMGHPTACAGALAVQRKIDSLNLLDAVKRQGALLVDKLHERFGNHAHVGDIRGRGLFQGIELVAERAGKTTFAPEKKLHARIKKHAFLPAVISYIALFYLVDLEAAKNGMKGLPKSGPLRSAMQKVNGFLIGIAVTGVLAAITYFGIGWMKDAFGDNAGLVLTVILIAIYILLIKFAAQYPDLELDDPNAEVVELPEMGPTAKTGFHYLLPIVVLVWFLMIERKSPGLSAFWATALLIFQVLTQKPLKAFFRGESDYVGAFKSGVADLLAGMADGARNMIGIGVATATAGIIVGAVSLTGIGQVMAELVEFLSGGHLMVMLVLVTIISLILGMGLPTTANYIVVSSLMAGVVVQLGAQEGLIVPLIAVHLFVFYFGIMADVTPPVGLASFAAAAVSGGDPLKTGFVAFFYSLRTVMLPFLFIFNTDLLLIDVGWVDGIIVFIVATAAMLVFAAGTQGYFFARSKMYESVLLILIAFTLFRPGFWLDMVWAPYEQVDATKIEELATQMDSGAEIRVKVGGENLATGQRVEKFVVLPLGEKMDDGAERLMTNAGLGLEERDGKMIVADVGFGSPAEKAKIDFDWEVMVVELTADRLPKEIFWLPALGLLGLIIVIQRRRGKAPGEA